MQKAKLRLLAALAAVLPFAASGPAFGQQPHSEALTAPFACPLPVLPSEDVTALVARVYQGQLAVLVPARMFEAAATSEQVRAEIERFCTSAVDASASAAPAKGAASTGSQPSPPPAPATSTVRSETRSHGAAEVVSNVLMPGEDYRPLTDRPLAQRKPTGVVLLDERETARNTSLCRALLGERTATVRTEEDARRDDPDGDYLVTHWPVRAAVVNEKDCTELLRKYHFTRAAGIKAAYGLGDSRGPIFLAIDPTGEIVFLDLEDASPAQVFKATSDWMTLALVSPQNRPAAAARVSLLGGVNKMFASVATGFSSLVGSGGAPPLVIRFNDATGAPRQFNIYKAGVYLIGATFRL